jgi:hypothetical protein
MTATIIQGKELWQTVAASLVAGIGITFVFSLAIWGVGQFAELNRDDRPLAAAAAAATAGLAIAIVAAAVIAGIVVMAQK